MGKWTREQLVFFMNCRHGCATSKTIWCDMAARKGLLPSEKKLAAVGAESLLHLVSVGNPYRVIAEGVGVSIVALKNFLSLPEHEAQYARAREEKAENLADELLEIADLNPGTTPQGGTDSGAVQHQRLRVDTRKWLISKQLPKKYGDNSTLDLGNKDDKPFKTEQHDITKLSTQELIALRAVISKAQVKPE